MQQPRLRVVPCTHAEANAFVVELHRHHGKTVGHKVSIACADETGKVRGMAIIGRPVARKLDNGQTMEVTRLCTDGCPNACSFLYGAAWRVAKALGYARLITYILESEPGTSLKAAGWRMDGISPGKSWSVPTRKRKDKHPLGPKQRWIVGEAF